jgi:dihydroorotate dehydrogenase electron transfer subunit
MPPSLTPHYPLRAAHESVVVCQQQQLAPEIFRLRFHCPPIARQIVPGQFVMIRLAEGDDPLLGRAFALYDTVADASGCFDCVDIVYLVVGRLTSRLAKLSTGAALQVWGPLGNGFAPEPADHLLMVAGGIGQTPFLALAKECLGRQRYGSPPRPGSRPQRVTLCYGARNAAGLAGIDDFRQAGVDVQISTEDGSRGQQGLVTDLVRPLLAESTQSVRIVCCGPEAMMHAVARLAADAEVPCHVSLESPMACGLGICFSCVVKVATPRGGWDYRRTCIDGPVFDARQIVWESPDGSRGR